MKKPFSYLVLTILFFSIHSVELCGQQTSINTNPQANFNHALKLFNSKAYAGAQKYFVQVSEDANNKTGIKADADYYDAMCAIRLNQTDADKKVLTFVDNYPNSRKKDKAYFTVGNYYFANKKAAYALKWYSKVNPDALSVGNKKELDFKMGYAFLATRNLDLAKNKFIALINDPKLIFADEPSGNLDTQSANNLYDLFFKIRDKYNTTFIIVTHNERLAEMADRKIEIIDGEINKQN